MNKSRSSSSRASAAASVASIVGSLLATTALATTPPNPQSLPPPSSGPVSVPVWGSGASNDMTPTGTGLAYCTHSGCGTGQLTVDQIASDLDGGLLEIAGTTNLNPFGSDDLTFAFAAGNVSPIASVEFPGFGTYLADVQACDPNLAIPCPSTDSGTNATRDTLGNITFSATATTGLPTQTVAFLNVTDVYAIYTNAPVSALMDPSGTITFTDGLTESFDSFGLTPPASTVPEPSVLALLAAGLATLWLGLSLRRRARR
jgi:hypothetical protein